MKNQNERLKKCLMKVAQSPKWKTKATEGGKDHCKKSQH